MTDHTLAWTDALAADRPVLALRQVAQDRLAAGAQREALSDELTRLVAELRRQRREADEDAVADVLDMLAGWCHPDLKL